MCPKIQDNKFSKKIEIKWLESSNNSPQILNKLQKFVRIFLKI